MFDVFKFFIKVFWAIFYECSEVKAYHKACYDFVVAVGVEINVIVSVCGFAVDFKSLTIFKFNNQDVIRFFFIGEVDGGFSIV